MLEANRNLIFKYYAIADGTKHKIKCTIFIFRKDTYICQVILLY